MKEKIKSDFLFSTPYVDTEGREQFATVTLHISYRTRTYDVTPYTGNSHFLFKNNSHQWKMWKAVLQSIDEAIDFANKEINNIGIEDLPDAPPVVNYNPMAGEPIAQPYSQKSNVMLPSEIPAEIPEPDYKING